MLMVQAVAYPAGEEAPALYQKHKFSQPGFRDGDERGLSLETVQTHGKQLRGDMLVPEFRVDPEGAQLVLCLMVLQDIDPHDLVLKSCQDEAAHPFGQLQHDLVEPVAEAGIVRRRNGQLGPQGVYQAAEVSCQKGRLDSFVYDLHCITRKSVARGA